MRTDLGMRAVADWLPKLAGRMPALPVAGVIDQYAGPSTSDGCCRYKSTIQGPIARLKSFCRPAVKGISFRGPLEPLVGTKCDTGCRVRTRASPSTIRSIQGSRES